MGNKKKKNYRVASKRKESKHHHNLSIPVKEDIHKLRALGFTYNSIASKLGISYATVEYWLKKAKNDPDIIKAARAKAYEEMAGEVTEKAREALQHITPDSLTHDRVVHYDEHGNVKSVAHSGPTGQQIALTYGILQDKAAQLLDRADTIRDGGARGALNPADLKALLESAGGSIKRLQMLNVDIDGLSAVEAQFSELSGQIDAEYEVVEDDDEHCEVSGE